MLAPDADELDGHREDIRRVLADVLREHLRPETQALEAARCPTRRLVAMAALLEAAHAWEMWLTVEPCRRSGKVLAVGISGRL